MVKSKIKILGTNHISKHSVNEIKRSFEDFDPDIVAVELDKNRLQALQDTALNGLSRRSPPLSMIKRVGVTGWLFLFIGGIVQRKLAGIVKVIPGVDMLTAVQLALQNGKQVALVDQDMNVTLHSLSRRFTLREKLRVIFDIFASPFHMKKYKIKIDRVPNKSTINKLMRMMKERYPNLHYVLIEERNIHMCASLDRLTRGLEPKKILLVIGAGHEEDLRERLSLMERAEIV